MRPIVRVLVAVFVPGLLFLALLGAMGWTRATAGAAAAMVIGLGLSLRRRLRRRPWKLLVITSTLSLVLALICHVLTWQSVVVENHSGQSARLRVSTRGGIGDGPDFDLFMPNGTTLRWGFEGPFLCHGVTCDGVLRDHTPLEVDASADAYFETTHRSTHIQIEPHGVCHYVAR